MCLPVNLSAQHTRQKYKFVELEKIPFDSIFDNHPKDPLSYTGIVRFTLYTESLIAGYLYGITPLATIPLCYVYFCDTPLRKEYKVKDPNVRHRIIDELRYKTQATRLKDEISIVKRCIFANWLLLALFTAAPIRVGSSISCAAINFSGLRYISSIAPLMPLR